MLITSTRGNEKLSPQDSYPADFEMLNFCWHKKGKRLTVKGYATFARVSLLQITLIKEILDQVHDGQLPSSNETLITFEQFLQVERKARRHLWRNSLEGWPRSVDPAYRRTLPGKLDTLAQKIQRSGFNFYYGEEPGVGYHIWLEEKLT